jgi:hypothetical protein
LSEQRICADEFCDTILSRYNPDDVCSVHLRARFSEPIWEDPPIGRGRRNESIWLDILGPVTERPNTWARVRTWASSKTAAHSAARSLRDGSFKMPEGRWEFQAKVFEGGSAIWARYLGPVQVIKIEDRSQSRRRA